MSFLMSRTYVDISEWWPKNDEGKPLSVYAVHKEIEENNINLVNRYTLTRARDGLLEKGNFANLKSLARLCSKWSGQVITVDDLLKEEN